MKGKSTSLNSLPYFGQYLDKTVDCFDAQAKYTTLSRNDENNRHCESAREKSFGDEAICRLWKQNLNRFLILFLLRSWRHAVTWSG